MSGYAAGFALLALLWLAYVLRPKYGATLTVMVAAGVLVYQLRNGVGVGAWAKA